MRLLSNIWTRSKTGNRPIKITVVAKYWSLISLHLFLWELCAEEKSFNHQIINHSWACNLYLKERVLVSVHSYSCVTSKAVLTGGGIRPAAATLRSLLRKLKVAHAFGWKTAGMENKYRGQLFFTVIQGVDALSLEGILYRVLHLYSDAFFLKQSQHWGVNSFNSCTCAQH